MTQITKEWSIFHRKWRPLSASMEGPTMVDTAAAAARYLHGRRVSFVSPLNRQDQIKLDSKNIFPRRVQWPTLHSFTLFMTNSEAAFLSARRTQIALQSAMIHHWRCRTEGCLPNELFLVPYIADILLYYTPTSVIGVWRIQCGYGLERAG